MFKRARAGLEARETGGGLGAEGARERALTFQNIPGGAGRLAGRVPGVWGRYAAQGLSSMFCVNAAVLIPGPRRDGALHKKQGLILCDTSGFTLRMLLSLYLSPSPKQVPRKMPLSWHLTKINAPTPTKLGRVIDEDTCWVISQYHHTGQKRPLCPDEDLQAVNTSGQTAWLCDASTAERVQGRTQTVTVQTTYKLQKSRFGLFFVRLKIRYFSCPVQNMILL